MTGTYHTEKSSVRACLHPDFHIKNIIMQEYINFQADDLFIIHLKVSTIFFYTIS